MTARAIITRLYASKARGNGVVDYLGVLPMSVCRISRVIVLICELVKILSAKRGDGHLVKDKYRKEMRAY
jgi:hypothetical protein